MGTYERKTREIKKSLNRRSRMRRAYFKMIGEDPKAALQKKHAQSIDKEIDLSDVSDSDDEENTSRSTSTSDQAEASSQSASASKKKSKGKQLASKKRAEKFHLQKEAEERLKDRQQQRAQHKNAMQKRTSRGQPRLGAQMGVLLDKLRKSA